MTRVDGGAFDIDGLFLPGGKWRLGLSGKDRRLPRWLRMEAVLLSGRVRGMRVQTFRLWIVACLHICFLAVFAAPAQAKTLTLSFPLQCTLHKTCFIQNYVDTNPSPGHQDYRCGQATYDGHKGTDFRVVSVTDAKEGVPVIAAAPGRVKAIRDGMKDQLVDKDTHFLQGRECGNGVVIDHGQGWETQYCHLRRASVRVRQGQQIKPGEPIGLVGYSGKAQFAHLHLSVRHRGRVIDPFTGKNVEGRCGGNMQKGLWQAGIEETLKYRHGELLGIGFADRPVSLRDLEEGKIGSARPSSVSKVIAFYARFINLEKGDRLRLVLIGPSGRLTQSTTKPLERHKAQYVAYVGRKLRAKRWPDGRYRGQVQLLRSGTVILDQEVVLNIQ